MTLPSVKITYTERRSSDGKHIQEPRNPGEAEEPAAGFSGGVPVADREAGALRRLAAIMAPRKRRLIAYHQGDPRGCALYIVRRRDIPAGASVESFYNRGVAVCT